MLKVNWSYVESAHKYATEPKILHYGFARNLYVRRGIFISNGTCFFYFFLGIRKWETKPDLLGLKFSQECLWRRRSSGIERCVIGRSDPNVSTQRIVFIFNGKHAQYKLILTFRPLKLRKLRYVETSGYGHSVDQRRIPKEWNPKQNLFVRRRPDLLIETLQTKNSNLYRKNHKIVYFKFKYYLTAVHWLLTNSLTHGEELTVPRLVDNPPLPPRILWNKKNSIPHTHFWSRRRYST
jgi:hypothetical protein